MRRALLVLVLAGLALGEARACGVCIEDKIAAVYDHRAVQQALARRHHVLFFVIEGTLVDSAAQKKVLEGVAGSVYGADAGTVRVSTELGSLSFAFDPARTGFATVERSLQLKLRKRGLQVALLRVVDRPGA